MIQLVKVSAIILMFLATPAHTAEVEMPITVTLVRCVTQAERANMCEARHICCDLVPRKMTAARNQSETSGQEERVAASVGNVAE